MRSSNKKRTAIYLRAANSTIKTTELAGGHYELGFKNGLPEQ